MTKGANGEITIKTADWTADKNELSRIRRQVFIEEQNVPEDLEWDGLDESSEHFLAFSDNNAIACARLTSKGQIGRMAVLENHRGQGIGSALLRTVLRTVEESGRPNIYLHAQVSAIPFYEKHGFTCRGEVFFEADIPHREMIIDPE